MMWPPVGAFMWMQHAKSRLQDHHRERVYSSRLIRELFGAYPSYSQIFTSYSRAVCKTIFAATYSELSADIRVFFPGRVPRHIRPTYSLLSAVYSRLFCYKRITRINARIKVNSIWNKPSLRISEST